MNRISIYMTRISFLLYAASIFPQSVQAIPSQIIAEEDSVRVEELLVKDTLDLKIHGPGNDVNFYMNGMVFLSNTKYHQKMIPDHITFGVVKAYFVPLEYIALESSRPLFINDDFPYSPGGMSFTRDYRKVYFSKTVEISGRRKAEKIFEMSIVNGEGSNHNQLSFTGDPSRYLHPAISLDDSYMIFSSNRTSSIGGLDLFISRKTAAGWSSPTNMGSSINTSGDEWYPYLDPNNNLFFSSSGHMGYGGFDVYVCFFDGSGWGEPQNMTDYINSLDDELGFSIHPNKKTALFSKMINGDSKGDVMQMSLNNKAMLLSGIEDPQNQDISGLLQDMLKSGYTSGAFAAPTDVLEQAGFELALPLLTENEDSQVLEPAAEQEPETGSEPVLVETNSILVIQQSEPEPEPKPERESIQIVTEPEPEPVIEAVVTEPLAVEPDPEPEPEAILDPNRVVFRVQIISSSGPNSNPSVTISGTRYSTLEYFYKGAYRVTVGEFELVQDASNFRTRCRNAGYSQAFVAAFRGNERETDPSVFRK